MLGADDNPFQFGTRRAASLGLSEARTVPRPGLEPPESTCFKGEKHNGAWAWEMFVGPSLPTNVFSKKDGFPWQMVHRAQNLTSGTHIQQKPTKSPCAPIPPDPSAVWPSPRPSQWTPARQDLPKQKINYNILGLFFLGGEPRLMAFKGKPKRNRPQAARVS